MSAVLQIDGRVDAAEREISRLNKVVLGLRDSMQQAAGSSAMIEGETKKSARAAMELGTSGKVAAAMYQAALASARMELQAGTIGQQEYKRQVELAAISLQQKTRELTKQAAEQERLRQFAAAVSQEVMTSGERQRARLKDLEGAWKSGYLGAEEYRRAVNNAHNAGTQLPGPLSDAKGMILGMAGSVASLATLFGAVGDAIERAREKAAALREIQTQKQLTVAETQGQVVQMLGMGVKSEEAGAFIDRIEKVAASSKFGDVALAQKAAADVLSATEGNQQLTIDVLKYALPMQRHSPSDIPAFAAAVADTSRYMDAKTEQDVKAATALVVSAVGKARITQYGDFKEAAKALAAANAASTSGDKTEAVRQSSAMWSALTNQLNDPAGAQTKTAFASIVATMEKLLPERTRVVAVEEGQAAELERKREHLRVKLDQLRREADTTPERNEVRKQAIEFELRDIDRDISSGRRTTAGGRSQRMTDTEMAELKMKRVDLEDRRRKMDEKVRDPAMVQADIRKAEADLEETNRKLTGETRKGTGLRDTYARVEQMWKSPEIQQQFRDSVEKGGFRQDTKLIVRELADPNSQLSKRVRGSMSGVSTNTAELDEMMKSLETATKPLALKVQEQEAKVALDQYDVKQDRTARFELAKKQVDELISRTGTPARKGIREFSLIPKGTPIIGSWVGGSAEEKYRRELQEDGASPEAFALSELLALRGDLLPRGDKRLREVNRFALDADLAPLVKGDDQAKLLLLNKEIQTTFGRLRRTSPELAVEFASMKGYDDFSRMTERKFVPEQTMPGKVAPAPIGAAPGASPLSAGVDPQMERNNQLLQGVVQRLEGLNNRMQTVVDGQRNAPTVGPSAAASAGLGAQREGR